MAAVLVVKKRGQEVTRDELLSFYEGKITRWRTPDDVIFVSEIPPGATGKVVKSRLREQFGGGHLTPRA